MCILMAGTNDYHGMQSQIYIVLGVPVITFYNEMKYFLKECPKNPYLIILYCQLSDIKFGNFLNRNHHRLHLNFSTHHRSFCNASVISCLTNNKRFILYFFLLDYLLHRKASFPVFSLNNTKTNLYIVYTKSTKKKNIIEINL